MSLSMHAASAPIFVRMLNNLSTWLDKAQAHAEAKPFDAANYLTMRLAPDMLPFDSQVKIAADVARMAMARLAGAELTKASDDAAGLPPLAALAARVRQAIEQIETYSAGDLQGSDAREVVLPQRGGDPLVFTGEVFLQRWALPNFFFHVTTAYALLRHAGVPIGKADYLGL